MDLIRQSRSKTRNPGFGYSITNAWRNGMICWLDRKGAKYLIDCFDINVSPLPWLYRWSMRDIWLDIVFSLGFSHITHTDRRDEVKGHRREQAHKILGDPKPWKSHCLLLQSVKSERSVQLQLKTSSWGMCVQVSYLEKDLMWVTYFEFS